MAIIGIAAKARSGKDTFADFIVKEFDSRGRLFSKTAFAAALKFLCMDSFGLTADQVYGDQKEIEDMRFHKQASIKPYCEELDNDKLPSPYWTPREIMQAVGSFYRSIEYDYWVKQLDKDIKSLAGKLNDWIITDIRHINECEYVRKNKGILIKVSRDSSEEIHGMNHESEISLDNYKDFDIYIDNNGTLEELEQAAFDTVNVITLIEKYVSEGGVYHGE